LHALDIKNHSIHGVINQIRSLGNLLGGAPGFFKPRVPPPLPHNPVNADALSYYDVAPLKATLERLVDFDRINAGAMRFSVGAVNVRSGNFVYFDTTTHRIGPAHVIASGSLPPGFPATEIEGQHYWDGGIVSNTPLEWVLDSQPHPRRNRSAQKNANTAPCLPSVAQATPRETAQRTAYEAARAGSRRACVQYHPHDLSREELRRHLQGL
jgi:predicted acylesterase/phospholipase RssA